MAGKYLIIIGLTIAAIGFIMSLGPKIPFMGRLPGDIYYRRDNFVFYFPLATSIVISIIATFILYIFFRR
jgi:hypothetical protein